MMANQDACMDPVIHQIDFSDAAMGWLDANRDKLEDMVSTGKKVWNLAEWESFEAWSNNQSTKLNDAWNQNYAMKEELERLQLERANLLQRIADLEHGPTVAEWPTYSRRGMYYLESLVRWFTSRDATQDLMTLLPAQDEDRIFDRITVLAGRMAHMAESREMMRRESGHTSDDGCDIIFDR